VPAGSAGAEAPLGPERSPAACEGDATADKEASANKPGRVLAKQDGSFCARVAPVSAGERAVVSIGFAGDERHLPTRSEVSLSPQLSALGLAFSSPSVELDMDDPGSRITLEVADPVVFDSPFPEPPLELILDMGGPQRRLKTTDWRRSNHILSFALPPGQLEAPGPARLLARYAGSPTLRPEEAQTVALRVIAVALQVEPVVADQEGLQVEVRAITSLGPAPGGEVTVRVDTGLVGRSLVREGTARVRVVGDPATATSLTITYTHPEPWWVAPPPTQLALEPIHPNPGTRWPWLLLMAGVVLVCVRALERPQSRRRPPPRRAPPQVSGGLIHSAPTAKAGGWAGIIIDAHEGTPIAGAIVTAKIPTLTANAQPLTAVTDSKGRYTLAAPPGTIPEGAMLNVSTPLHTEVVFNLPPPGRADVALVSRHRTLLQRLVRWAAAMGPPWHHESEPTPAQIADVARRRGDGATERWAQAIEAAAFDASEVDAVRESELRQAEPPWRGPSTP
jgi:hypothetical protein